MKRVIFLIALCAVCCCKNEDKGGTTPEPEKNVLLKGGDISMLTLVEDNGGKYYWNGVGTDCVKGLAANCRL